MIEGISGNTSQLNGLYLKEGNNTDDDEAPPVYKHRLCDMFIYYYGEGEAPRWLVGPSVGSVRGLVLNHDYNVSHPVNATQTWRVHKNGAWTDDGNVTVSCSCEGKNKTS